VKRAVLATLLFGAGCGLTLDFDPPDPRTGDGGSARTDSGAARFDAGAPTDATTPDAAPFVDATTLDAGPFDPTACGGPSFIQDHFDDATPPFWATTELIGGGAAREIGGRASFTVPPDSPGATAGYLSLQYFDAREDSTAVRVFPGPVPTGGEVAFALIHTEGTFAALALTAAGLQPVIAIGGLRMASPMPIRYDPTAHAWWRIRGSAGSVFFETSPDGTAWTRLASFIAIPFLEAVRVAIGVRARTALEGELSASFEDLGRAPSAVRQLACPIDSYHDTFSSALSPYRWARHGEDGTCELLYDPASDSLSIRPTGGPCGIDSLHAYDATRRSLTLEIAGGPSSSEYTVEVILHRPAGNVKVSCTGFTGLLVEGPMSGGFTCADHRFWRLGRDATNWNLEVSPDATSWTLLSSIPSTLDPARLQVTIRAVATTSMTIADDALLLTTYN
jgi:hypothetical protein